MSREQQIHHQVDRQRVLNSPLSTRHPGYFIHPSMQRTPPSGSRSQSFHPRVQSFPMSMGGQHQQMYRIQNPQTYSEVSHQLSPTTTSMPSPGFPAMYRDQRPQRVDAVQTMNNQNSIDHQRYSELLRSQYGTGNNRMQAHGESARYVPSQLPRKEYASFDGFNKKVHKGENDNNFDVNEAASFRHRPRSEEELCSTGSTSSTSCSTENHSNTPLKIKKRLREEPNSIAADSEIAKITNVVSEVLQGMVSRVVRNEQESSSEDTLLLADAISQFEQYVDDSYVGHSRSQSTETYNGGDAAIAKDILETCLRQLWPFCQIETYGSLSTGLWLPGQSDMDLLLNFQKLSLTPSSMLKYFAPISPPFPPQRQSNFPDIPEDKSERSPKSGNNTEIKGGGPRPVDDALVSNAYYHSWTRFMNQLYLLNGDLEYEHFDREELLIILSQVQCALVQQNWCTDVKLIPSAMPVVKVKIIHKRDNVAIPVDISVLNHDHLGLQARDYVCSVMNECPGIFRPLVLVLKQLLRENELNDVYTGGLGSYSLSLMVVFFLLRCGFLMNKSENEYDVAEMSDSELNWECSDEAEDHEKHNQINSAKTAPNFHQTTLPFCGQPEERLKLSENHARYPLESVLFESQEPSETLSAAANNINCITQSIRRTVVDNMLMNRKCLGRLLVAFMKMFSLPSDGGINLGEVGLCLFGNGKIFLHKKPANLCIRDPVAKHHYVGEGSFSMYKIQALFSKVYPILESSPEDIFDFINWQPKYETTADVAPIEKTPDIILPPVATPRKYDIDLQAMSSKLEAVHQSRCLRIKNNYERFLRETKARKKALGEKCLLVSKNAKDLHVTKRSVNKLASSVDRRLKSVIKAEKPVNNQETNIESFSRLEGDFWEHQKLLVSDEPVIENIADIVTKDEEESLASHSPSLSSPRSSLQQQTWAKVVKCPGSSSPTASESNAGGSPTLSYRSVNSPKGRQMRHRVSVHSQSSESGNKKKAKDHEEKLRQRPSSRLFIGNLSYTSTVSDIEALKDRFKEYGQIVDFSLNKQRGVLWLEYSSANAAMNALSSMDQQLFLNRPLYVDFSHTPRTQSTLDISQRSSSRLSNSGNSQIRR